MEALRPYIAAGQFKELQGIVREIQQRMQRMDQRARE
jgi:hypothetical protein